MIGAHAAGIQHDYKNINNTPGKCFVCGEYSECQMLLYEKSIHIFYIKIKVLEERYIFDWEKCNHRAELYEKKDVSRYKKEQGETGFMTVPYYQNMKLRFMEKPKKVSNLEIAIVLAVALLLSVLLVILFDKLDILFVF